MKKAKSKLVFNTEFFMSETDKIIQKIRKYQTFSRSELFKPTNISFVSSDSNDFLCLLPSMESGNIRMSLHWSVDGSDIESLFTLNSRSLSLEETLRKERERRLLNGVQDYFIVDRLVLIPDGKRVYSYSLDDQHISELPLNDLIKLDHKVCPGNSNLMSYVSLGDQHQGDVWIMNRKLQKEVQITSSASDVLNGVPEFCMQEEFNRSTGYWWNPQKRNGKYQILFLSVDQSQVPLVQLSVFGDSSVEEYRYPRTGDPNPQSSVFISSFNEELTEIHNTKITKFEELFPWCEYIVNCDWTPNGQSIWLQILSRNQQHCALVLYNLDNDEFTIVKEYRNDTWINVSDKVYFVGDDIISGHEEDGFHHLYLYTKVNDDKKYKEIQLTSGNWQVMYETKLWIDAPNDTIYFIANKDTPLESHLYSLSLHNPKKITRITKPGFTYSNVTFNGDLSCFVCTHSSLKSRTQCELYQRTMIRGKQKWQPLKNSIKFYIPKIGGELSQPEIFQFTSTTGEALFGCIYKPPNFDKEKKYPVILQVYNGPQAQIIKNCFSLYSLGQYQMFPAEGFVVIICDGRGSFNRGHAFETYLHNKFGRVELEDQIAAIKYVAETTDDPACQVQLDLTRVGIMGYSYGGYLSLHALIQHGDFFKRAASISGVTSWNLYDSAYTERYMGMPDENSSYYHMSNVHTQVAKLPDEPDRLFLAHGTADENVHFKALELLLKELNTQFKPYILKVYPGERHGLQKCRLHLLFELLKFFKGM